MAAERRNPSWRTTQPQAAVGPAGKSRFRGRRFVVLAIVLAIIGVVAGLLMFLRPPKQPIFVSIAVSEHVNRTMPPSPWARQDSEVLRTVFGKNSEGFQSQERDLILGELTRIADRTTNRADKKRPLIVHLCAHAVVRDNVVHLLVGFSQPDSDASWLPFADVLDVLRRCPGGSLVLLDAARPIAGTRLGFLADDAGTFIHAELKRLEAAGKLPYLVLTSCGEGEVSHTSAALKHSLFAFFVEQGLKGHADGWDAGKSKDGQVSARELEGYVRAQVAEWAAQSRLPAQAPAMYGSGKDFVLITPPAKPAPPALPEAPEPYPEWLNKAWLARDQWLADESWRRVPRSLRQLETALVRAEERWLAGDELQSLQNELQAEQIDLEKQRQKFAAAIYLPHSLALVQRQKRKDDPALAGKLQTIVDRLQSKTPFAQGELDMLWQKTFEKPIEAALVDVAALTLFRGLIDIPDPTREQLKAGLDAIAKLQPRPRHLELQLLQMVVDLEPSQWQHWQQQPGTAHVVLQAGQLAEQVAAADPRCFAWLQSEHAAADALRRDGTFQLAIGEAPERKLGREKLDDAVKRYQALLAAANALETGFQRQEEMFRLLPAIAPELGRRTPDPTDLQMWASLVQSTEKLTALLIPPSSPQMPATKEIESLAQDLAVMRTAISNRYDAEGLDRQLRRINTPNAPSANELLGQLRSPVWPAAQRARLYAAAARLDRDVAESAIARSAQLLPGASLPANSERLRDAPAWRAQLALDLLKLDGFSDLQSLPGDLSKAQAAPSSEAWQNLGARLRALRSAALIKRFKESESLLKQERAGWFVDTDDLAAVSAVANEPFSREPAAVLRRKQQAEFWRWLGDERYVKDANLFLKIATRPEVFAYGKALNEVGRELPGRSP